MTHTPETPDELLARQGDATDDARQVLELYTSLQLDMADALAVATTIVADLMKQHAEIACMMSSDPDASRTELCVWAVDADRLLSALQLLQSVDAPAMVEE
jgi:hypothetical protein